MVGMRIEFPPQAPRECTRSTRSPLFLPLHEPKPIEGSSWNYGVGAHGELGLLERDMALVGELGGGLSVGQ